MLRIVAFTCCLLLAACEGAGRSGDGFYVGGAGGIDRAERVR
ncbi:MAG: hypothetical protein ACK4QW_17475 [Alphaproteobacteria bacterium]